MVLCEKTGEACCIVCRKTYRSNFSVWTHYTRTHSGKGWDPAAKRVKCSICEGIFGCTGLKKHQTACKGKVQIQRPKKRVAWNKGLTKEDPRVALSASRTSISLKGKVHGPLSKEHKQKLSLLMKKRHAEGTAHNIGECRWKKEPSYPEKFFMGVIANDFDDKNYIYEKPVNRYSLDFAWLEKKKVIEIDGEQHLYEPQLSSDIRKDAYLTSVGWTIFRIPWRSMFNDTQKWIQKANEFIGA